MTRVLAFSDLHHGRGPAAALVAASAQADLIIGAGDFCNMRTGLPQALGLLSELKAPVVAVPGNAESAEELRAAAPDHWHVLHGQEVRVAGLTLFGLGYGVPVTPFGAWSCDLDEESAAGLLAPCMQADILVTHAPPKGVADVTSNGLSVGSTAIHAAITRVQPRLALCGHIHDSWGAEGMIGAARVVNLGPTVHWFEL